MDRNIVSDRLHCTELRYLKQRLPLPARSRNGAATRKLEGESAVELLLLIAASAASWAVLVSLSSSLR
jgi:hypothetical protein